VLKANNLQSGYIRPLVFFGAESMGLNPAKCLVHAAVAAWEWGAYLGEEGMEHGIRVKTSSYTRHHPNITMTRAKAVGNYPNSILAKSEAIACGFDEALLLDPDGFVSEGSGENIFILKQDKLLTPPLDSALDGITRNTVITLAKELNLSVLEQRFPRDEVLIADEAFFTGTAAEITPIRELDGRKIGIGHAGPITKTIQKLFFDVVYGRHPQHNGWLTPVE
ncbi:MAG: branched-chain-amino-acid transaminase, partial [Magnetococcales bacterium]|nr:branched-chain-amino-acid transaminase [Magnetococcales bacterium]